MQHFCKELCFCSHFVQEQVTLSHWCTLVCESGTQMSALENSCRGGSTLVVYMLQGGKAAEDVTHWRVLGVTTRHTNMMDFLALHSFKKFSAMKMVARSPLFFINARGHPSQSFRPAGKHDRERKGNMALRLNTKWNIQRRPHFTNKCILIVSIFTNKSQTITKRHATSIFHSLL